MITKLVIILIWVTWIVLRELL